MAKGWIENYVERGEAIAKEFTPDAVKLHPPRPDIPFKKYGLVMYATMESVVLGYTMEDGTVLVVSTVDLTIPTDNPISIAQRVATKLKISYADARDRVLKIGLGVRSMFPY